MKRALSQFLKEEKSRDSIIELAPLDVEDGVWVGRILEYDDQGILLSWDAKRVFVFWKDIASVGVNKPNTLLERKFQRIMQRGMCQNF